MSDETRQEKSSVESTVDGAAKTGKAIANIAKGAAVGGAHGAAVEAAKASKKWIAVIVALIALPRVPHDRISRSGADQEPRIP